MRREDRQITDENKIVDIVRRCPFVSVAFLDDNMPYVVPMNFGLLVENDIKTLYFHGAGEGYKLNLIAKNNRVAFAMVADNILKGGGSACSYTMKYQSVCGTGVASIVDDEEKEKGLAVIMKQYAPDKECNFSQNALNEVSLWKIEITSWSGKTNMKK